MRRTRFRVPIAGFLTAAAISLGAGQALLAQDSQENAKGKVGARQAMAGQGSGQYKGPGIKGKMNSTTNAERWAAAIRRADIRAAKIRNDHGKVKP